MLRGVGKLLSMPLPTVKHPLNSPDLSLVAESFTRSLQTNFSEVSVAVVSCPDLSLAPWSLAAPGLGGAPSIADVGGVPYLLPTPCTEKQYNIAEVARCCERDSGMVIGPSAVASKLLGKNAELVNNVSVSGEGTSVRSMCTKVTDEERDLYLCSSYPYPDFGLLGNLYLCNGDPGYVIHVVAKIRTGPDNFISCMNKGLAEDFSEPVAIGGTFLLQQGSARIHVMPGFSPCPITSEEAKDSWLHFYEMRAPLTHTSVFVSRDPGLDLRLEHSHCFSSHGDGGHYHGDTTPAEVWYEGYFNVTECIYRVDQPGETHMMGRD